MVQHTMAMVLLSKGALNSGGGGVGFAILILLALIIALAYFALPFIIAPFILIHHAATHNTEHDLLYDGPLAMAAKIAMATFALALLILLINSIHCQSFVVLLLILSTILAYLIWHHHYFRHLHTLGTDGAMRSIRILLVVLGFLTALGTVLIIQNSEGSQLNRFDKTIIKAEQSPILQIDCHIPDIHLGMSRTAFFDIIYRMELDDSVTISDFNSSILYQVYSTDRDRSMSITPTFIDDKLAILHLGDYGGNGSDPLKADIRRSGLLKGFKSITVPPSKINSDGTLRYPRHMHALCNNYQQNLLYNYEDHLYLKDNMLIVFTIMGVSFINMPQITEY